MMKFTLHHCTIPWHILVNTSDPGAKVIGLDKSDADLQVTAAQNPDGSIAVVVFNEGKELKTFELSLGRNIKINNHTTPSNSNYSSTK